MVENFWILLATIILAGVLVGVFYVGMYIGRRQFKGVMKFEPKELRGLSSRTKAVLLRHKGGILKGLGGKG